MRFLRGKCFVLVCLLALGIGVEIGGGGLLAVFWDPQWFPHAVSKATIDSGRAGWFRRIRDGTPVVHRARGTMPAIGASKTLRELEAIHGSDGITYRLANMIAHPQVDRVSVISTFGPSGTNHAASRAYVIGMLDDQKRPVLAVDLTRFTGNREQIQVFCVGDNGKKRPANILSPEGTKHGAFLIGDPPDATNIEIQLADGSIFRIRLDDRRHELYRAQNALLTLGPSSATAAPA
jgi:hypothetical protein